ncbi:MAG: LytTR family transcriptional regulator [Sphingobacteriales bacterium]|nr:MAG: LytTR family transcriptional regulator [Sphingobacteriales bacterium]
MILLLLLLNAMAFGWNQYFRRSRHMRNKKSMAKLQVANHIATNEIACLYVDNGICHYRTPQGNRFVWTATFEEAEVQLGPGYFTIRRGVMVSRSAIVEVLVEGKQLKVVLAFEVPISLVVSHRKLAEFKQWLAQENN